MLEDLRPLVTTSVTAACAIISVAVPLVTSWIKRYFEVRESAAMNQTVVSAASREAAMLLSACADLKAVSVGDAGLVELAQDLLDHYSEYCGKLGIDLARAQRLVLGEAHKLYNTGFVPAASISASVATATPSSVTVASVRRVPKE